MSRTELELIKSAKDGDPASLTELINVYRAQGLRWAEAIVRDPYLAEDAFQEACLRVHRKLDGLNDASLFHAWFRRIVRHSAMNLIRGERNRIPLLADPNEPPYPDTISTESASVDPLFALISKETEQESMNSIDAVTNKKAQSVMKTLIAEDSSPKEIAERLQIAKSNVYNIISRSRNKANEERFRLEMNRYLTGRKQSALPGMKLLETPGLSRPYSIFSVALLEVLRYAGERHWTLTDIMGISGDAFRLNVTDRCHWRGISTFDWSYAVYQCMERLGWRVDCFGRPGRNQLSPEQQTKVLCLIHQSIDKGLPVIAWNIIINEFSLIYGYDDEDRFIVCRSFREKEVRCSYEQLGRNCEEPGLFVAALDRRMAGPASDRATLQALTEHVKGNDPKIPGFAFGINGYRSWLESIQNGSLDLLGHAYQVAILCESRQYARCFLESLGKRAKPERMRDAIMHAAHCYGRVNDSLRLLYPSFPFGYSGASGINHSLADGLQKAMEAEIEAVSYLEYSLTDD
ncbi:RNA polymerase sigma factor [Paenibacillus sp. sptzw28]|uniref:RNA polymerase sigma factor n=1 Tax=Paenibacillus sp. sptzw28 TaxID=715179 RepID=UPI001C6E17B2|nr:RNA polymerase sigma factor [Paenibacillus sp. sptzw28]QYR20755.1 RNA polymerase sigma factor [Paenibacillus sp. sptzw28]